MPDNKTTDEPLPRIPVGVAMNISDTAASLVNDADAVAITPTETNRQDFIASMRIMLHRIHKAFAEIGLEP